MSPTGFPLQEEIEKAADWWARWLTDARNRDGVPMYPPEEVRLFREELVRALIIECQTETLAGREPWAELGHKYGHPEGALQVALMALVLYSPDPIAKAEFVFPTDCGTVITPGSVAVRTDHYGESTFNLLQTGDLADRTPPSQGLAPRQR